MKFSILLICFLVKLASSRTTKEPSSFEEWQNGDTDRWCRRSRNRHLCPSTTSSPSATSRPATSGPATTQPPGGWNTQPQNLPVEQLNKIKSVCASRDCTTQPASVQKERKEIVASVAKIVGQRAADEAAVETYKAKVALFDRDALGSFVTPYDDGTYNGMLLTKNQAAKVKASFQARSSAVSKKAPPPAPRGRKRRNALFFPDDISMKWDTNRPIDYMIESTFSSAQVATVERALADIMHKSCIQFRRVTSRPSRNYLEFIKADNAGFCGLSWMGRVEPYNTIWINFATTYCGQNAQGIVEHETLHALGIDHQHTRFDRDRYIRMNWQNIDPQSYDLFAVDSSTSSTYGIEYDYMSVLHYGPKVGVTNGNNDAMTALKEEWHNQPAMGQREAMSAKDAHILNKLYCMPDCSDRMSWCGLWANDGHCEKSFRSMEYHCKKSCDLCPTDAQRKS